MQTVAGSMSCHRFLRFEAFVLALPFHSSVLEPDFDLSFAEVERVSDLDASLPCQIAIVVKLLLQLEALVSSVGRS